MTITFKHEPARYVRLAPTTLHLVPDCYGEQKPDPVSEQCRLCLVRKQCETGQETEMRSVVKSISKQ